jgi:hypothetical protein
MGSNNRSNFRSTGATLVGAFGSGLISLMVSGGVSSAIQGGAYNTFIEDGTWVFDPTKGIKHALYEGMFGILFGGILGAIGKIALPFADPQAVPPGVADDLLKQVTLSVAQSSTFKFMVNTWAKLTGRGTIKWEMFMQKLENAEFIKPELLKAHFKYFGWAGKNEADDWVLALGYRNVPSNSAIQHELFHFIQDYTDDIFSMGSKIPLSKSLPIEYVANLFAGPIVNASIINAVIAACSIIGGGVTGILSDDIYTYMEGNP